MAQLLSEAGYHAVDEAARAKVLIVNTCGFIGPARDESFSVLRELAEHKRKGQLLIAAGCLTQRYGIEVARQVAGHRWHPGHTPLDGHRERGRAAARRPRTLNRCTTSRRRPRLAR